MSSGAPFSADELVSAAKLNKKTLTYTSDISMEVKLPGQIFIHETDNGSFLKDDVSMWNHDEDGYVFLSQSKHLHNADTNQAGGLMRDILAANIGNFLQFSKPIGLAIEEFTSSGSGGSTTKDPSSGAIKLDTSTGSGNYRVLQMTGVRPSFGQYSVMQTKMQFTGNVTNQFARWGFNLESMAVSNDSTSKYGIESCHATNGNWFIVTADDSSRSQQDSLKPLLGSGSVQSYRVEYFPGSSVDFIYATDSAVSKTTNLPQSGSPPPQNNVVNYGVKTTDTNAKQLFVWGLVVVADEADPSWA